MLKSASILHAVFLCFTIAVLCGAFLYLFSFHKLNTSKLLIEDSLLDKSDSCFDLFLARTSTLNGNLNEKYDDFDPVHCEIKKMNWGLFPLIERKTFFKKDTIYKHALLGVKLRRENALYVSDFGESIKISGTTLITGDISIPNARIETANILGNQFVNNPKITGEIFKSQKNLPQLIDINLSIPADAIETTIDEIKDTYSDGINSFSNKTYVVDLSDINVLGNILLKGNYILISNGYLKISRQAKLEDVIIIGNEIEIEKGFEGTVQVFAKKNIEINKRVRLKYPSSLVLNYEGEGSEETYIKINEQSTVLGSVILRSNIQEVKKATLFIEKDSEIYGTLYCKGNLQLKGEVFGSVYAEKLFLKTEYSEYSDILLNTKIDLKGLDLNFVKTPIFKNNLTKDYAIVKEL